MENDTASETFKWNSLWTVLLFAVGAIVLYEIRWRTSRKYKLSKSIPCPQCLPLIGSGLLVYGLSNAEMVTLAKHYFKVVGETLRFWLGPHLVVFLSNPCDIELILSSTNHLEKADEYRFFKPWLGNGLLLSNDHHWRHHRKIIAPTFHQSILKSFISAFVQHSKIVVERMAKEVGKEFDVHDYMSQTTVEILLTTAMGVHNFSDENKSLEYAKAVMDMCDIIHKRQFKVLYRLDVTYKMSNLCTKEKRVMNIISDMANKIIGERMENFNADARSIVETENSVAQRKQQVKKVGLRDDLDDQDENEVGSKKRLALLDAMMEMSKNGNVGWTYKDILDEVNTIMFAGHETTAATSSFALLMLGIHKDIQEKVWLEQKSIFGDNIMRDCTFADIVEMKYLEQVIMETLRLFPPVPFIARRTNHDIKLVSGPYIIPKDATVVVMQFAVQRNAKHFSNPEKFNPDNFQPDKTVNRHFYSFIPFSAGPRSCVGRKFAMLKLKVLLSTIIRSYSVHCRQSEDDFKLQGDIILKLEGGFNLILEPRKYVATAV